MEDLEKPLDSYKILCRACLSPSTTDTMSEFETKFENSNLYEVYKSCVEVEVDPDDKLPQYICKSCLKKLVQAHTFKEQCQKSDVILKTAMKEFKKSENSESAVIIVMESDLPKIVKIEESINEYEIPHSDNVIHECKIQEENLGLEIQSDPLPIEIVKKTHRRRIYKCPKCPKSFTSSFFKSHLRTHTNEKPYSCSYCQKKFSLGGNLSRHIKIHTGEKPHVCEICNKGFIQARSLIEHRRTHTGETAYMCCYCGIQFSQYGKYKVHLTKHNGSMAESETPRHGCTVCSSVFSTKRLLNQHMLIHGEKTFLCSHCGKGFVSSGTLESHLRTHTGTKPYSCNVCNKSYRHLLSLKSHKLTHTGEKPYSCKICSKNFTQSSHLKSHLRIHSGEKPYVCTFCNKAFALKGNLTVHIRTHTGETPYLCDICNKGFNDSTNLKRHKKRHYELLIVNNV